MKEGDFMKVYSKEDLDTYITSVVRDEDSDVYHVTFANGDVYDNIPIIPENTETIENRLTVQANAAVDQKMKLVRSQKVGTVARFSTTFVAGAIIGCATLLGTGEPVMMGVAAGTICISGLVWTVRHKQAMDAKVEEVNDFEQRLSQREKMDEFLTTSPNAYRYLDGSTDDEKTDRMDYIQAMKNDGRDPFSFIEVENGGITSAEIGSLSHGMVREKTLGFTYTKK